MMYITDRGEAPSQYRLIRDIFLLLDDDNRRVLETVQLTPLEFAVLQHLDTVHGQRLTDVGAALLCVKSTITRLVDRLERDGLLLRGPDPADRRAQRLLLTPKGATVRAEALALQRAVVERREAYLSQPEQLQLCGLLEKLRADLQSELVERG